MKQIDYDSLSETVGIYFTKREIELLTDVLKKADLEEPEINRLYQEFKNVSFELRDFSA